MPAAGNSGGDVERFEFAHSARADVEGAGEAADQEAGALADHPGDGFDADDELARGGVLAVLRRARERIVLCPCYSDYPRIDAARQAARAEALGKLGIGPGDRYFFSAARLAAAKGLDQMIRAFVEGKFAERGYHYFVAGVGPLEAELKALAGTAYGKSIRFLGFQQPRDNLLFMANAEAFVLPSVYEPHGIVIPEAMAAGTPVIATDVCGAAYDLIQPGVNGELFRVGDVARLRRILEDLVGNPARHAAMRAAARRDFESWLAETSPITVVPQVVRRLLSGKH